MRYRSDPINPHFVGALNLLEVEFADDKRVTGAWKKLLEELNEVWPEGLSEEQKAVRNKRSLDAQTRLLSAVAKNLGLSIEQLDIHGGYSQKGWFNLEAEQTYIRQLVREIPEGKRGLNVVVWEGKKPAQ